MTPKAERVPVARPVLKWAGGKRRLLPEILKRLPARINTYYEPFVGGAAVFFALAGERRFQRAVLSDRNEELVGVYRAIQTDVEGLIRALTRMRRLHDEQTYYDVRDRQRPRGLIQRAARTIYLNKTGYNGLYRVNRSGLFNVPCGRYKNPAICDANNLRAAARALCDVRLEVEDFEQICKRASPGDVVYFDPPYLPVSKTANFTDYHNLPFGVLEHRRLARVFAKLAARRVEALLSNSDTPETRAIFQDFRLQVIRVSRPINSDVAGRGPVNELLVHNLGCR